MFRLGLTGSIATGKSTALKAFKDFGVPTYSADAAVHALYRGEAVAPLEVLFPGVTVDGEIDRAILGQRLVANPERFPELEAVVHPLVGKKMQEFLREAEENGAKLAVLDIPLLFETRTKYPVDAVAITVCSDEEQRRRALARPGMDVEKLQTILAQQMPQAEKKQRADFVIDTNGAIEESREQVKKIITLCQTRANSSTRKHS